MKIEEVIRMLGLAVQKTETLNDFFERENLSFKVTSVILSREIEKALWTLKDLRGVEILVSDILGDIPSGYQDIDAFDLVVSPIKKED